MRLRVYLVILDLFENDNNREAIARLYRDWGFGTPGKTSWTIFLTALATIPKGYGPKGLLSERCQGERRQEVVASFGRNLRVATGTESCHQNFVHCHQEFLQGLIVTAGTIAELSTKRAPSNGTSLELSLRESRFEHHVSFPSEIK